MIRLRNFAPILIYILGTYLVMLFLDRATVDFVTAEDHYFENFGAFSLLVASLCMAVAAWISRNSLSRLQRVSIVMLALLFFFGAGEEISWGQRIFNYETPEDVSEVNAKDEVNLHNLAIFHDGGKNSLPFKAFQAFWFVYALVIPVTAARWEKARRFFQRFLYIVPWSFGILFLVNFLLASILSRIAFMGQPGEIQESNHEMLFMMVSITVLVAVWNKRAARQEEPVKAWTPMQTAR